MSKEKKKESEEIWFEKLSFSQAVKSLEHVCNQLCKARDDTYYRARAEAESEVLRKVIKEIISQLIDRTRE